MKDSLEEKEKAVTSSSPYDVGVNRLENSLEKEEEPISTSYSPYDYSILEDEKKHIICDGSRNDYDTLNTEQYDNENSRDLLAYALLMANKYDYAMAYYDVYDILKSMGGCESGCKDDKLNCLDDKTRAMALEYLVLAVEKETSSYAKEEYNRLKSEGIIE